MLKNINKLLEQQFSSSSPAGAAPMGGYSGPPPLHPIHVNIMNKQPLSKRLLKGAALIGTGMALGSRYLAKKIGKHNHVPDEEFNQKQLKMGISIEKEHVNDPKLSKSIAKDHLAELPDYYSRLKKMESGKKYNGKGKK